MFFSKKNTDEYHLHHLYHCEIFENRYVVFLKVTLIFLHIYTCVLCLNWGDWS